MKNLEIFFQLYLPSITDMQKAVLKKSLVELYGEFDMTWDTDFSTKKAKEFPTFSDLYQLIREKAEKETNGGVYDDLAL